MSTNTLDKIFQLIDTLDATERQKLAHYLSDQTANEQAPDQPGRASRLLAVAKKMNFSSGQTDVSERSREILDTEFGDYLDNHMS